MSDNEELIHALEDLIKNRREWLEMLIREDKVPMIDYDKMFFTEVQKIVELFKEKVRPYYEKGEN